MDGMKSEIKNMLQGIERYNPENIKTLEHYVDLQVFNFENLHRKTFGTAVNRPGVKDKIIGTAK